MSFSPTTPSISRRVIGPSQRQSTCAVPLTVPSATNPAAAGPASGRTARGRRNDVSGQLETLPDYPLATSSNALRDKAIQRQLMSPPTRPVDGGARGPVRNSSILLGGYGGPAHQGHGHRSNASSTNDCVLIDDEDDDISTAPMHSGLSSGPLLSRSVAGSSSGNLCSSAGVPSALQSAKKLPAPPLTGLGTHLRRSTHTKDAQTPGAFHIGSILITGGATAGTPLHESGTHATTAGASTGSGGARKRWSGAKFNVSNLDTSCIDSSDGPHSSNSSPSVALHKAKVHTTATTDTGSNMVTPSTDSLAHSSSNAMGEYLPRSRSLHVNFSYKALIGKGSYGHVYQAMDRDTNRIIAVKEISLGSGSVGGSGGSADGGGGGGKNSLQFQKRLASVRKELAVLKQLDHPNIVKYLGEDCEVDCLRIYMEYVGGGSVSSLLRKFVKMDEKQTSTFTYQILNGLVYLHSKGIIHRDLKGDNLLVDTNGSLKLADFGTAKDMSVAGTTTHAVVGTAYFLAPEAVSADAQVDEKVDIWALGCCIIEMLTGSPPLSHIKNHFTVMMTLTNLEGEIADQYIPKDNEWSPDALDIIHRCLRRNPKERPTARELLSHRWITKYSDLIVDYGPVSYTVLTNGFQAVPARHTDSLPQEGQQRSQRKDRKAKKEKQREKRDKSNDAPSRTSSSVTRGDRDGVGSSCVMSDGTCEGRTPYLTPPRKEKSRSSICRRTLTDRNLLTSPHYGYSLPLSPQSSHSGFGPRDDGDTRMSASFLPSLPLVMRSQSAIGAGERTPRGKLQSNFLTSPTDPSGMPRR